MGLFSYFAARLHSCMTMSRLNWRAETIDQAKLKATLEEIEPRIQELEALAAEYEAKIYAAAKPVPRKYEIVRVSD